MENQQQQKVTKMVFLSIVVVTGIVASYGFYYFNFNNSRFGSEDNQMNDLLQDNTRILDLDSFFEQIEQPINQERLSEIEQNRVSNQIPVASEVQNIYDKYFTPLFEKVNAFSSRTVKSQKLINQLEQDNLELITCRKNATELYQNHTKEEPEEIKVLKARSGVLDVERKQLNEKQRQRQTEIFSKEQLFRQLKKQVAELQTSLGRDTNQRKKIIQDTIEQIRISQDECNEKFQEWKEKQALSNERKIQIEKELSQAQDALEQQTELISNDKAIVVLEYENYIANHKQALELLEIELQEVNLHILECEQNPLVLQKIQNDLENVDEQRKKEELQVEELQKQTEQTTDELKQDKEDQKQSIKQVEKINQEINQIKKEITQIEQDAGINIAERDQKFAQQFQKCMLKLQVMNYNYAQLEKSMPQQSSYFQKPINALLEIVNSVILN